MDVGGLGPFVNFAYFDRLRELHWCNDAISHAITYYRVVTGETASYDQLLNSAGTVSGIEALLYGAMRAATLITPERFARIFNGERLGEYIECVREGLNEYLPENEIAEVAVVDAPGDEEWPEVKPKIKKKKKRLTLGDGTQD